MEEKRTNEVYSLKDFAIMNGCNSRCVVRARTNKETGVSFFVLSFEQPGKTVKNSKGEDVQAWYDIAFGKNTQKLNGLTPMQKSDREVLAWVKEHIGELKAGLTFNRETGAENKIPSCWLPSAEADLW